MKKITYYNKEGDRVTTFDKADFDRTLDENERTYKQKYPNQCVALWCRVKKQEDLDFCTDHAWEYLR